MEDITRRRGKVVDQRHLQSALKNGTPAYVKLVILIHGLGAAQFDLDGAALPLGEIADDDAGKGAAAGAAAGALMGGMRRRDQMAQQKQKEQEWAQKEAANYEARRNEYNRAYTACLEAKGYTVK